MSSPIILAIETYYLLSKSNKSINLNCSTNNNFNLLWCASVAAAN